MMEFAHLARPAAFRSPLGMVACKDESLRLKGGRLMVSEVLPVKVPDVPRSCGLNGPDRQSIWVPGAKESESAASRGRG